MSEENKKEELMKFLRSCVSRDPVPVTVVDMTSLGLVEVTRKKIKKPLHEQIFAADSSKSSSKFPKKSVDTGNV